MRQPSEDYKFFKYLALCFLSNILIIAQDHIKTTQWVSSNIAGNPVNVSISDDPATESIYYLGDLRKNFHKKITARELGVGDINEGITTRQITGAGRLYKKCAPGVVILYSLDGSSMGSGAIISKKGEIITNWHVVEGQEKMLVWIYNVNTTSGKNIDPDAYFTARVIAEDPGRDLAMLIIENNSNNLVTLTLGRDYEVNIADDVFAIGHPEGYFWSFTYGVISQIRKNWDWTYGDSENFTADVIQTQTPTNPGNSGGPLFNDVGKLVGINSFGSAGQGLNFAVTVGEVRSFITNARKGEFEPLDRTVVWDSYDSDENGTADIWLRDIDDDGKYDIAKTDENEDGVIDYYSFDSNGDESPDIFVYDDDGNGTYEYYLLDENYDGKIDTIGIDTDGDREPDQYFEYQEE